MKLPSLLLALALAGTASAASAQGALYLDPAAVRATISKADPGLYSFLGPGTTSRMFYGVVFGGFYNVPTSYKSVQIGLEAREQILHGNNALLNSFLVGPRIAGAPFANHPRFVPYVEPVVGAGTTRAPETTIKITKLQYGIFAGADLNFSKRVAWRVAEAGYSSLVTASGGTIGASESIPAAHLLNISTGLTFRLP